MTKSEGVSLLSGTTNVKVPMDFTGKTAGNTATNANQYFTDVTAKVLKNQKIHGMKFLNLITTN